jgi:hypothetical protein
MYIDHQATPSTRQTDTRVFNIDWLIDVLSFATKHNSFITMRPVLVVLLFISTGFSIIHTRRDYNISSSLTATGQGTGLGYAISCIKSKLRRAKDGGSRYGMETVIMTSDVWTNTRNHASYDTATYLENSTAYTLCNGWPRLDGTTSVIKRTDRRTATTTTFYTTIFGFLDGVPCSQLHDSDI